MEQVLTGGSDEGIELGFITSSVSSLHAFVPRIFFRFAIHFNTFDKAYYENTMLKMHLCSYENKLESLLWQPFTSLADLNIQ